MSKLLSALISRRVRRGLRKRDRADACRRACRHDEGAGRQGRTEARDQGKRKAEVARRQDVDGRLRIQVDGFRRCADRRRDAAGEDVQDEEDDGRKEEGLRCGASRGAKGIEQFVGRRGDGREEPWPTRASRSSRRTRRRPSRRTSARARPASKLFFASRKAGCSPCLFYCTRAPRRATLRAARSRTPASYVFLHGRIPAPPCRDRRDDRRARRPLPRRRGRDARGSQAQPAGGSSRSGRDDRRGCGARDARGDRRGASSPAQLVGIYTLGCARQRRDVRALHVRGDGARATSRTAPRPRHRARAVAHLRGARRAPRRSSQPARPALRRRLSRGHGAGLPT